MLSNILKSGVLLLLLIMLAGCASKNIRQPTPLQKLDQAEVHPQVVWDRRAGSGPKKFTALGLTVHDKRIYVASYKGKIQELKLEKNARQWAKSTGLTLLAGPTYHDGELLVTTRDGLLVSFSAKNGDKLWQAKLATESLVRPVVVDDEVIVRTVDGAVSAYEMGSGNRIWSRDFSMPDLTTHGGSTPLAVNNHLYVGLDNGQVVALDPATGQQQWQQAVALPDGRNDLENLVDIDAELASVGNQLYVASVGNKVASLSLSSGRIRWTRNVSSATALAIEDRYLYTTDLAGEIHAFKRLSGSPVWSQDAFKYRHVTGPVVYHGYVVFADFEGYLHFLDAKTGKIAGRIQLLSEPIHNRPLVVGDMLLVMGAKGRVATVTLDK